MFYIRVYWEMGAQVQFAWEDISLALNCCIDIGIELLFYLGKLLAMRLLFQAPRTVHTHTTNT